MKIFKRIVSKIIRRFVYEIHRINKSELSNKPKLVFEFDYESSTENRPIGDVNTFLNDICKRGFKCRYVFDIGANKSEYSRMIKKVFPDSDFLLIDPLIEMEVYMKNFCKEFKNSEYIITGVGSKKEKHILTTLGDSLSGSTMMLKELPGLKKANKQREVEVVTIDSIIQKHQKKIPDFVKIDVQGFELEVLKGAETLFGKTELFVIEVSLFKFNELTPEVSEIINFMSERNYVIYDIPGFLRRPYDGALGQLDLCFIKKDSFLKKNNTWIK